MKLRDVQLPGYTGLLASFRKPVNMMSVFSAERSADIRRQLDACGAGDEATVFERNGQTGYRAPDVRSCKQLNPSTDLRAGVERALLTAFRSVIERDLKRSSFWLHGGLQFLRYDVRPDGTKDHFAFHADGAIFQNGQWNVNTPDRHLTFVAYVNGDFEGGDFEFQNVARANGQNFAVKPEPGLALLFPADPRFVHRVAPMASGTRYAIVGWITLGQS
jgi:predicted 2-oxoglutarate/Fe(II)-dependent dioxygenase YbiX